MAHPGMITYQRSRGILEQSRSGSGLSVLPFKKYPPRLIAKMVYNIVFWLYTFPHKDGVHTTISPKTPITGLGKDYHKHAFGTYVQVHEEGNSNNTLRPRTSGAIALWPTGNEQGGYYYTPERI